MSLNITEISLKDFRNYDYRHDTFSKKHTLFFGNNGVGKTSLLEAISLLSPGAGVRSAASKDIVRHGESIWGASFKILNDDCIVDSVNIGFDSKKKIIKIADKIAKSSAKLLDLIKVLWFTPQMNHVFISDKAVRQKFFDRIISIFDSDHLRNLIIYERLKQERKAILNFSGNSDWLDIIEEKISITCLKITRTRVAVIKLLQDAVNVENNFIRIEIKLKCQVLDLISGNDKQFISTLMQKFCFQRAQDKISNKTLFGSHLADFDALYQNKISAKFCSTGEQKSILLALMLAVAKKLDVLLLDDISASLDDGNFHDFISVVLNIGCQVFFTDLTCERFKKYRDLVNFIEVKNNQNRILI